MVIFLGEIMELSKYNPIVILLYFISNILITMLTKNPVFIMISFVSSIIYAIVLKFPNKIYKQIILITLLILISALTNPLFNKMGDTIVLQIGKNKFSYEAIFYGFIAALMIITIIIWFRNYNLVMSSDKFLYLFSKCFPNISLIISMILKLIPDMLKKIKDLDDAQKVIGIYARKGFFKKLKNRFLILGSLFSWTIEHALISAESMKARGYGISGKTHYRVYKFKFRDALMCVYIIASFLYIIIFNSNILLNYTFYPLVAPVALNSISIVGYIIFFLLANLATFLHVKEKIKWHYLKLKIYPSPIV